jgi:hypothetical protein
MTREGGAAPSRQQTEPVGQAVEELLRGQDPRSDRRKLDRQRQTVEPAAEIHDGRLVRGGQLEAARCRQRPLREQQDRLVLSQPGQWPGSDGRGQLERR